MARPPKNAEGPSATQRMEMAFWDCLKEMPYSDIVVRDIVDRAKVNRNSYYYHYESMWDLAQASVLHAKFTDLARLLMSQKTFNPDNPVREFSEEAQKGFEMLQILSSENGNQRLLENAKTVITEEWLAMFGCENVLISKRTESEIDFVFGGITAMLASPNLNTLESLVTCIASSEILLETLKTMRQIIRACEPEKIQKAVASLHPTHEAKNEQVPSENHENEENSEAEEGHEKDAVESLVERIIEEELKSEQLREEEESSEEESAQDPTIAEETQQQTEDKNETVSAQDIGTEPQSEDRFASEESIDIVSADDEAQEASASDGYGQEPVEEPASKTAVVSEIEIERTVEVTRIEEIIVEETTELEARTQVSEQEIEPVQQEETVQAAIDEPAEEDEEESQLSLDFIF